MKGHDNKAGQQKGHQSQERSQIIKIMYKKQYKKIIIRKDDASIAI